MATAKKETKDITIDGTKFMLDIRTEHLPGIMLVFKLIRGILEDLLERTKATEEKTAAKKPAAKKAAKPAAKKAAVKKGGKKKNGK